MDLHQLTQFLCGKKSAINQKPSTYLYRFQDDPESVKKVGISWAGQQCAELLDRGVRGIHFFTLNQSSATQEIYQSLGAPSGAKLRNSH